jgi:hypothetical protein
MGSARLFGRRREVLLATSARARPAVAALALGLVAVSLAAADAPATVLSVLRVRTSEPSSFDPGAQRDRARASLADGLTNGSFARTGRGADHDALSETSIRHSLPVGPGARAQTPAHATTPPRARPGAAATGAHASGAPASASGAPASASGQSSAPAPAGASFRGLVDDISFIPPDTTGAVGPAHVMETLNSQVAIFDRAGAIVPGYPKDLTTFWSGTGSQFTDPRVVYDPYASRWITIVDADFGAAHSKLGIAISDTADPTQTWKRWALDTDPSGNDWCDYPTLGFNKDWIVSTCNMFSVSSGNATNSRVFVFHKANLYAGAADTPTVTVMPAADGFTMQPVLTYDSTIATEYMLQSWNGSSGGKGFAALYAIGASQVPSAPVKISVASTWAAEPPQEDFAPQSGTGDLVNTGDDRMIEAVYRNGSIWGAQTVFVPANAPARSDAQWWQVAPTGTLQSFGRLDAPGKFYAYPSLSVNRDGDALVGFSTFSASQHPSAGYVVRHADGTLDPEQVLKAGVDSYHKTYDSNPATARNRWGDYSSTHVDPLDDSGFWTIQEYAEAHANDPVRCAPDSRCDRWGTWWGQVVSARNGAQLQLSSPSLAFGDQRPGTTSAPLSTTVRNNGSTDLAVASVSASGDFHVASSTCGAPLRAGDSCAIAVTFTPTAAGARTGTLTIASNAAGSPATAPLSGTGATAALTLSPAPLDFGEQSVTTTTGTARSLTVRNASASAIAIASVTISGANGAEFNVASDGCSGRTIASSATCVVQAAFTPAGAGARTALVTVKHNGAGGAATGAVTGLGIAPVVEFSPASVQFPVAKTGVASDTQAITVTNTGRGTLANVSVHVDGANAADFEIAANTCTAPSYAQGAHCSISVRFTPHGGGARTASLSIVSNAPAPASAALSGTGDGAPPVSSFRTPDNSIVIGPSGTIDGDATDDFSGVSAATLTLTPLAGDARSVALTLSCNAARTQCAWSAPAPATPGLYTANVRGVDRVGNAESPGRSISIFVL